MLNRPETVIAFLACASVGAIWSSCAPDMGPNVVLDRLRQIEPKVLFATDSYRYNGKAQDRTPQVESLLANLPSVRHVMHMHGPAHITSAVSWRRRLDWSECIQHAEPPRCERVPFSHPLWIVYSSGTTGLPKATRKMPPSS